MLETRANIIMDRIVSATPESPIIVYRISRMDGSSYLSSAFARTVHGYRDIRYPKLSKAVIGCFHNEMDLKEVRNLIYDEEKQI